MGTAPSGTETLIASPRLPKTIVVLSCTAITGSGITGGAAPAAASPATASLPHSRKPGQLRAAARCPAGWARKAAAGPLHLHAALVAVRSVACRRPPQVDLAARSGARHCPGC